MPVIVNTLLPYSARTYDARGYKIEEVMLDANTLHGATEVAELHLALNPPWRAVAYVVVEAPHG